jgi:mono/diheme cytochrome c family protein
MMLLRRWLIGLAGLLVIGLGFSVLAWRSPIDPIAPPAPASFPPDLVARGEALAGGGYCATCHTAKGGERFAGGYAMQTPFGVIYSTNITPEPETGIGTWSEAAFARAMREGVARDGSHLFPAFPYTHFTKLSDNDVRALYAYLMTRSPVRAAARANGLPFPVNIRALQAGWKLLFFRPERFQPDAAKSAEWNRGAYLAQGLSHCGACHTPRNFLGAEKQNDDAYAGALIDDWIAPPLTDANPAPAPWTQDELRHYLGIGASVLHGTAAGPMAAVVHGGLSALPDADVQAIAAYFADIDRAREREAAVDAAVSRAMSYASLGTGQEFNADARLYMAACASCHYNASKAPLAVRPDLALNSALSLPDPTNLIQVMLRGISASEGLPGIVMPGFAQGFSDSDIALIAAYLRRTRTDLRPWTDLDKTIAAVRQQIDASR